MTIQIRLRGGSASDHSGFTGLNREVTVDTTTSALRVHDGVTVGGHELLRADMENLTADISDSATLGGWTPDYYLNYNNLNNKPFIPTAVADIVGAASISYVDTRISNLVNGAGGALDTLNELAAALGNDANFAATVSSQLAGKVSKGGDTIDYLEVLNTTAATNQTTGALIVGGGVGVSGDIHANRFVGDGSLLTNVGGLVGLSFPSTYIGDAITFDVSNYAILGAVAPSSDPQAITISGGVISLAGNPTNFIAAGFDVGGTLTITKDLYSALLVDSAIITDVTATTITINQNITLTDTISWTSGGSIVQVPTYNDGPKQNVAVGPYSLDNRTASAEKNSSLGENASEHITSGIGNTTVGFKAGNALTTGGHNVFVGEESAVAMLNGSYNIVIGYKGLNTATTGNNIVAIGKDVLHSKGPSSGNIVAIGLSAGYNYGAGGASASGATIIGPEAGYNAGGIGIVAIGQQALFSSTGTACIGIGANAGSGMTSGNYNVILGGNNGSSITGNSNNILFSDGQGNIASNWQYGGGWYQANNSSTWSTTSDQRIKENIVDFTSGLDIVMALRPREFDRIVEGTHEVAFVAQEYEQVLPDQVSSTKIASPELLALTDNDPIKCITYNLNPYLVSAIQTLKQENDALKARLDAAGL